jgi:hypothetical protein
VNFGFLVGNLGSLKLYKMKILKTKNIDQLIGADLSQVTEIHAMDMCLDELPQDFFLSAKTLEILYLKSSWRQAGLPTIPSTVRQLFCCNWGRRGGSRSSEAPKPARNPFKPELPPAAPENQGQPAEIEHNEKTWNWDPRSQRWEKQMINLNALPAGLEKLYISEVSMLGTLDFSRFTKMEELILNQCEIGQIVAWPPNVRLIYANWNNLESVPEFPKSVEIVELNKNQLTDLPKIDHTQLRTLRVDKNQLKTIPILPKSLEELRAENNTLVSLPKVIPAGMTRLYVRCNKLTLLPIIQNSQLEELFCGFNKLAELPQLPVTLEQLYCHDNRLPSLGLLHEGLQELYCGYNKLTEHPALPSTCTEFNGVGNQFGEMEIYVAQVHMLRYQMENGMVKKNLA